MNLKLFQIDAFSDSVFGGNPAAVIPLDHWLPDETMQKIGMENNLSETAFFVKEKDHFHLRWFTPLSEVDLCGHATLATAYVIFNHLSFESSVIQFQSRSGILTVTKEKDLLTLDFPTDSIKQVEAPEALSRAFSTKPTECWKGKTDFMLVFDSDKDVYSASPDMRLINSLDARGVIITAKGKDVDFVSRFFAPQCGVDEDPVTGSAHTTLTPYWGNVLNKNKLSARQVSKRGGQLNCEWKNDRTLISGKAVTYMIGEITFPNDLLLMTID
ncbi:MAG: PhzF family phenazine biosynthesis protein [Flammeovirgaceae bacterium]|nr:PhzF family phenazine biosynthesis protein [Flammeovirgaceae bacterium]